MAVKIIFSRFSILTMTVHLGACDSSSRQGFTTSANIRTKLGPHIFALFSIRLLNFKSRLILNVGVRAFRIISVNIVIDRGVEYVTDGK